IGDLQLVLRGELFERIIQAACLDAVPLRRLAALGLDGRGSADGEQCGKNARIEAIPGWRSPRRAVVTLAGVHRSPMDRKGGSGRRHAADIGPSSSCNAWVRGDPTSFCARWRAPLL